MRVRSTSPSPALQRLWERAEGDLGAGRCRDLRVGWAQPVPAVWTRGLRPGWFWTFINWT